MVQVIENWAVLRGQLESIDPVGEGGADLVIQVTDAAPVEGFPNLLTEVVGRTVTVRLPSGLDSLQLRADDRIRFEARKAGPERYIARPGTFTRELRRPQ